MALAPAGEPGRRAGEFVHRHQPPRLRAAPADRNFDHYQDDSVYHEQRPSAWVEPKATIGSGWGPGAVQLVEPPTGDETSDNIVAFWHPSDKPRPGQELLLAIASTGVRNRHSRPPGTDGRHPNRPGGVVGRKRRYFSWRFAVILWRRTRHLG